MTMSMGVEKVLPFDSHTINEFGAMHMDIHSDTHEYFIRR